MSKQPQQVTPTPEILSILENLSEDLNQTELAGLVSMLDDYLKEIKSALATNEFINVELGQIIWHRCHDLVSHYTELDSAGRSAVVGAVRYFIESEDAEDDLDSVIGLEDDAQVVNYVIQQTGLDIPLIDLED